MLTDCLFSIGYLILFLLPPFAMEFDLQALFDRYDADASGRVCSEELEHLTINAAFKCGAATTSAELETLIREAVSEPHFQSGDGWDFETFDKWFRTHAMRHSSGEDKKTKQSRGSKGQSRLASCTALHTSCSVDKKNHAGWVSQTEETTSADAICCCSSALAAMQDQITQLQLALAAVQAGNQSGNTGEAKEDEAGRGKGTQVLKSKDLVTMDANGDGVIDREEFFAGGGSSDQFEKLDANGDNLLDASEMEKIEQSYELQGSYWDISLLVGLDCVGSAGNAYGMMLLMLNIFVQIVLVWIINESLTDPDFTDESVAGFRKWRISIAHDVLNVDPMASLSLAARTCADDSALHTSSSQATTFSNIQAYLELSDLLHCERGPGKHKCVSQR